jgi:hypothetical protein
MTWLPAWLESTRFSYFMSHAVYAWPTCAILHFLGLTLMIGTVGLFDLRLLGVATALSPVAMHRLIPWGVAGFLINLVTGVFFMIGQPLRYVGNPAFELKLILLVVLGLNMLLFYSATYRKVVALGPGAPIPMTAKIAAATSLIGWLAVICAGRMIAFFIA